MVPCVWKIAIHEMWQAFEVLFWEIVLCVVCMYLHLFPIGKIGRAHV